MKSKKSKATDIPYKVKEKVWERDNYSCIYCGKTGYSVMPNAHFISRANNGLGIEQNIVTLCLECHNNFDHGCKEIRSKYRQFIRNYLKSKYENWNEDSLIYKKGE